AQAHHHCRFDYAMSFPFFGEPFDSSACDLQLGRDLALACGNGDAHLRLVDVTSDNSMGEVNFDTTVKSLIQVADDLDTYGIRLTIEHSFQTWDLFWPLFQEVRTRSRTGNLWLCFDPANFSLAGEADRIEDIVANVDKSVISMLHVKQANHGTIETELCSGEVDWPVVVQEFTKAGYSGPTMFEFVSSPEVGRVIHESLRKWQSWLAHEGNA
ncbi:MAG: TIM barrel protein, partial [Planctomycetota bacterium]|nr:TIM barrel protein [Planctomycetota bacterium]